MFYKLHNMLGCLRFFFPGTVCSFKTLEITVVNRRCSQDLHAARRTAVVNGLASNFRFWKYVNSMP